MHMPHEENLFIQLQFWIVLGKGGQNSAVSFIDDWSVVGICFVG